MKRAILYGFFVFCFYIFLPFYISYAGEWVLREDGYYYINDEYNENRWLKDYGYWFYLGANGKMKTGYVNGFFLNDGSYEDVPYGALIEDNPIEVVDCIIDDITYYKIQREDVEFKKIIFILHDLAGNREDVKKYGTQLASEDNLVFVPNLYAHSNSNEIGDLVDIINNTSKYIDIILQEEGIEDNDIVILGAGVGGMIGADYVVSGEHTLSKLILLNSMPDISRLDNDIYYAVYQNGEITGRLSKDRIKIKLKENTPFIYLDGFKNIDMFILNHTININFDYQYVLEVVAQLNTKADIKYKGVDTKDGMLTKSDYMDAVKYIEGWK